MHRLSKIKIKKIKNKSSEPRLSLNFKKHTCLRVGSVRLQFLFPENHSDEIQSALRMYQLHLGVIRSHLESACSSIEQEMLPASMVVVRH